MVPGCKPPVEYCVTDGGDIGWIGIVYLDHVCLKSKYVGWMCDVQTLSLDPIIVDKLYIQIKTM